MIGDLLEDGNYLVDVLDIKAGGLVCAADILEPDCGFMANGVPGNVGNVGVMPVDGVINPL